MVSSCVSRCPFFLCYRSSPHSSAADEISGETVAIKLVTRVFEKTQLAKRALREITLLRHFAGHENITGLIDVDAISMNFNEMYVVLLRISVWRDLTSPQSYIFMEVNHCQPHKLYSYLSNLVSTAHGG